MSFPMQGKHCNCKKEEERHRNSYERYIVDCWLQNKKPESPEEWERLNKKLRDYAAQKLTKT